MGENLVNGWRLIRSVKFSSNHDPEPVMASCKQHEQRLYRLEFKIPTYQYPLHFVSQPGLGEERFFVPHLTANISCLVTS